MTEIAVISMSDLEAVVKRAVSEAIESAKPPEAWLTVDEVARRLSKSERTIRNWIHDGRFSRVTGGDGCPYLLSSLEVAELMRSANSSGDAS